MQENDLLICAPCDELRTEGEKPHEICARVTKTDPENGTVYLDCYVNRGRLHLERRIGKPFPMKDAELYYRPMREEEIREFRDGLAELVRQNQKSDNLVYAAKTLDVCESRLRETAENTSAASPEALDRGICEMLLTNVIAWADEVSGQVAHDMLHGMGISPEQLDALGFDKNNFPKLHRWVLEN